MPSPNAHRKVALRGTVPGHVPAELVHDYDFVHGAEVQAFPPSSLDDLRDAKRVFYSTYYGGFWVFTRYEDIRKAYQTADLFEQNDGIPPVPYGRKFIPLRLNPPEHIGYRRLMTPIFAPRQIRRLENMIRDVARQRLAELAPRGKADFVRDFALALPAAMFCGFVGFDADRFATFHDVMHKLVYEPQEAMLSGGMEAAKKVRSEAMTEIDQIVIEMIARHRDHGGGGRDENAISILLDARIEDRPLTDEEILNMVTLLFFAGTDSTAATISYALMFLAAHPAHKDTLIQNLDDQDFVWKAAEELIRFHGFHQLGRTVTRDETFLGVQLKKGDHVLLPVNSANRDAAKFGDPLAVDFARKNANNHLTFGAGIHRCIGSHLATSQLRIALQEVHKAIPDYSLAGTVSFLSGGPKAVPAAVPVTYTPTTYPSV